MPKVGHLIKSGLVPYLVTQTVANGPDLGERLRHLRRALRVQHRRAAQRRLMGRGRMTERSRASGVFQSIEIKRGRGSGMWHPHAHGIWMCEGEPDATALGAEWSDITGDSYIVDVRPISYAGEDELIGGLCEVCAYVSKFSAMAPEDLWHMHTVTQGQHLRQSYGAMRWTRAESEALDSYALDTPLDGPYVDMLYRWSEARGYVQEQSRTEMDDAAQWDYTREAWA